MRITFLAHYPGRGGSNALLRQLADFFRAAGHAVTTVVGQDDAEPVLTDYVVAGVPVAAPWRERLRRLQEAIEATRPEVVYSFSGKDEFDVLRFLSCVRVRHVFSLEQHDYADMFHWLRQAGAFPEAITTSTADTLAEVMPYRAGQTAGWCVPYWVEPEFEQASRNAAEPRGKDDLPLEICFVGRLEAQQKRVHWLPEIAASCAAAGRSLQWHLYGDGPALAGLRSAWTSGYVRFHGWCPAAELAAALPRHDVFFLCSQWEGLPLAMVQGMFCGLACVVPDLPAGMRHALAAGGGWLYAARTPAAAVQALLQATADRAECQRRGAVAHATAVREFSSVQAQRQWTALMTGLAGLKPNGRRASLAGARRFHAVPVQRAVWRRMLALVRPGRERYDA